QLHERLETLRQRDTFECSHLNHLQVEAFARHDLAFQPARCADEENLCIRRATFKLARQGNPRIDVPTGSAGCNQYFHKHSAAILSTRIGFNYLRAWKCSTTRLTQTS